MAYSYVCRIPVKSVTWHIHTCAAFHSKVSNGVFIRVPHSIYKCQMAYSYVCRIPFKSVTWRIHTCAAFHLQVSNGVFIRVPHSIQKCQMAYSYVCRIPFTSVTWRIHRVTSLGCVMSTTGIFCVLSRIGGTTTKAQTLTSFHKMTRNPCLIYVFPTIT